MKALPIIVCLAVLLGAAQSIAQSQLAFPIAGVFTGCSRGKFSSGAVITQCSKAAAGAGIEYRHWWRNQGAAISYMRSPTSSKLIDSPPHFFEWGIDRTEIDLMFLHRFSAPSGWRIAPYVRAGVAAIALDGGKWSGLDRQCAAVFGASAHIRLSSRFSLEAGANYDSLYASTYGDQHYRSSLTYMWEPTLALVMTLGLKRRPQ